MKKKNKSSKLLGIAVSTASHIMIVLGLNLLVLLVIDTFFNHAMNFLGNHFFKLGSMLFIVFGIFLALVSLRRENTGSDASADITVHTDPDMFHAREIDRHFRKH